MTQAETGADNLLRITPQELGLSDWTIGPILCSGNGTEYFVLTSSGYKEEMDEIPEWFESQQQARDSFIKQFQEVDEGFTETIRPVWRRIPEIVVRKGNARAKYAIYSRLRFEESGA